MERESIDWWPQVMGFALKMCRRLMTSGRSGFEHISENEYRSRIAANAASGCYVDVANLAMLAFMLKGESNMSDFKQYRRTGLSEMRPYVKGEDLSGVSVSSEDHPEDDMGMIARNPKNHADQWYVARKYFEDNLEPA